MSDERRLILDWLRSQATVWKNDSDRVCDAWREALEFAAEEIEEGRHLPAPPSTPEGR